MQQLPLAISPPPAPTFDNFIEGANAEALLRVQELAEGRLRETVLYLWGDAGSGRSHLLRAAATAASPACELVVADDVQALD
ncbi:MAG: DnaA/Hda family protein, partial [Burkholderiales bacterium]